MMKNKYAYILLLLLTTVGLTVSCSEFAIIEYDENDSALYFIRETYGQKDSIDYSFASITRDGPDTVYLDIRTMGHLSDMDRPFVLKQTNTEDEDAAVPGVHYVPFDDEQVARYFVVPANKDRVRLPIILLRDPSLDTMRVRLELTIEENEYFRPGIDIWRKILVTSTSELVRPSTWNENWGYYLGAWGKVKMQFVIDVTGLTDWETRPSDFGFYSYIQGIVKAALTKYNAENPDNPLREADGTLVAF